VYVCVERENCEKIIISISNSNSLRAVDNIIYIYIVARGDNTLYTYNLPARRRGVRIRAHVCVCALKRV
jgi:hypothetical protein